MSAKEKLAEIKKRGLLRCGNLQDELNEMAVSFEEELIELRGKCDALQLSHDNIINSLGIKGDGPVSKLVIEYVHGLVAENARMREAIEFATAPDMWQEQHDGMLDYRYVDWYVDVLNAAVEPKGRNAAIAEIKAQGVDEFTTKIGDKASQLSPASNVYKVLKGVVFSGVEFAANLRAGRKG